MKTLSLIPFSSCTILHPPFPYVCPCPSQPLCYPKPRKVEKKNPRCSMEFFCVLLPHSHSPCFLSSLVAVFIVCMYVCLLLSFLLLAFPHRNAWHEFVQKKYSLSRERTSSSREHRLSFPSPFFHPLIIVKALRCVRRTLIRERREQKKVTFPRTTQREQHKKIIR